MYNECEVKGAFERGLTFAEEVGLWYNSRASKLGLIKNGQFELYSPPPLDGPKLEPPPS